MNRRNYMGRLLALLLLTIIICFTFYGLPNHLSGVKIKKVDLLSDIRIKPSAISADSLQILLEQDDILEIDTVAVIDSIVETTGLDAGILAQRDSLYKRLYSVDEADASGEAIEDYSPGHIGLKRFFEALNKRHELGRPVRVAFLGDSFIEGDIIVADFRSSMQKKFGGRGVGFVPISSVASQYRPTVESKSNGWKTWSMINDKNHSYIFSGMLFEPKSNKVSISIKNTKYFPELPTVSSLKLIYDRNEQTVMHLVTNEGTDSLSRTLPPTQVIAQNEIKGEFTDAQYTFINTDGFRALGVAIEDNEGIVVDNFSLRGNSGLILQRLSVASSHELSEVRPYDLIVLQYGLNVIDQEMLQYGWYSTRMIDVIRHIQTCYPNTDILMLSVSDRAYMENGSFETMPAVLALLHAQRQVAKRTGIPFWNMFGAMGGENSMVRFVDKNWASKDYTHLSFRGGREIANALMEALMKEKEFYDEAEKAIH